MDFSVLEQLSAGFSDLSTWFSDFALYITGVLVAAAVIYTTFLAWRKYRAATNRV